MMTGISSVRSCVMVICWLIPRAYLNADFLAKIRANCVYNTMVKENPADPRSHLLIGTWKGVHRQAAVNGQAIATGYTLRIDTLNRQALANQC
jgi:hypothetical protein